MLVNNAAVFDVSASRHLILRVVGVDVKEDISITFMALQVSGESYGFFHHPLIAGLMTMAQTVC